MSVSWDDFIDRYPEWSESTLRTRISELDEIGSGDEVVDVILDFPTEQLKGQLIRRAIRHKVIFSHDDFENLDGELSDADYRALAAYTGFDADCPHIDDNNLTWDDFYNNFSEWSSRDVMRRIAILTELGPADEIVEALLGMPDSDYENALYQKAVRSGVRFTREQRIELDWLTGEYEDDDTDTPPEEQSKPNRIGFFGALAALFSVFPREEKHPHDNGRCDGNCDTCPAHFGYRYGRWYYGHGHQWGCEYGGNGGASGKSNRD